MTEMIMGSIYDILALFLASFFIIGEGVYRWRRALRFISIFRGKSSLAAESYQPRNQPNECSSVQILDLTRLSGGMDGWMDGWIDRKIS